MKFKVLRDCYHGGKFYAVTVNGTRGPEANVIDFHGEEIPRHFEPADLEAEKRVEQLTAAATKELAPGAKPAEAALAVKGITRGKKTPTAKLAALQAAVANKRKAALEAEEDPVDESAAGEGEAAEGEKPARGGRGKKTKE
jgi:hypothetical protein